MRTAIAFILGTVTFVATTVACRRDSVEVHDYTPDWKTHESQSRGISEEYASRFDRDLHTRVCEAK